MNKTKLIQEEQIDESARVMQFVVKRLCGS